MKNIKKATIALAIALIVTAGIFIACEKDGNNTSKGNIAKVAAPENISYDGKPVDFSKIGYENGMLVFKSFDDYFQTIDAVLATCENYSANYLVELEKRFGLPIDKIDEDELLKVVSEDNFFPYNPVMDFIQKINFKESAYPMLRDQEIEWLKSSFETAKNPFDVVGIGYVQSALHNNKGEVLIESNILDWSADPYSSKSKASCRTNDETYKDSPIFTYNGKRRILKGLLRSHSNRLYAKTGCYYYIGNSNNAVLWTNRVEQLSTAAKMVGGCNASTYFVLAKPDGSGTGLCEAYIYHNDKSPAYIYNPNGHIGYTFSTHECKNYSGKIKIEF